MNISRFFIDRPIFAGVLSVLIFVAGLIALRSMPISEYPEVVPPQIVVRATYPGANPRVIAETVATPIEEAINGVEDMLYMSSQATTDGLMTLTVTFRLGTDPDKAQQLVQNRVSQAEPRLPEEVRRLGVTTVKSSPDLMMVVHLLSPNDRYDMTYLRNYAVLNVRDLLTRIDGVGQVQLFGSGDYSMRIWLDPDKVAELGLSAGDVVNEIRAQNVQAAAGVVGAAPSVPGGFVPGQDKQYLVGFAQLPDGASLDRTEEVIRQMGEIALQQPGVRDAIAFPGLSINGFTNSSNAGIVFVGLDDFHLRKDPTLSGNAIAMQLNQKFAGIEEAFIATFPPPPPPVQGLGTIGGFKLQLQDRTGQGYAALDQATKAFVARAYQTPELAGIFSSYQVNVPQLYADIDRTRARQLGVSVTDVFETLQIYLGSLYMNDFNKFCRTYSVRVQADAEYRARAEDIGRLQVRSSNGEMVPLSAVLRVKEAAGPERAMRYNGFLSADVNGGAAPGFSSGEAQAAIDRIAAETLPPGMAYEWTELTYQEILAGNSANLVFPLAILLVFLVLAAQYESLTLPIAIILIVPMGLLAAMAGVWLSGGDNNVFTQIGLIVLVRLSAKNAILIVEFARELELSGMKPVEAAIEASRLRLRPILMTSLAFIMGVVPLVISSGAGAEMRQAMGIAVFSGMIGVTVFGIFLTPVFYVLLRRLAGNRALKHVGGPVAGPGHALPSDQVM